MRRLIFAIVPVAAFNAVANAQTVDPVSRLDSYMSPLVSLNVFSGTIAVADGDRIVLERSYGHADAENQIKNGRATVFRIASISKSFTRALVGRLADQKQLGLDDPLSRWLPAIPSATKITLRMLLDHRAGIPSINSLRYDEEAIGPNTLSALVDSIAKRPLDFEPGTKRSYSNGGYAVLARVIELAARASYDSVLTREILRPLGLHHTRHEADGMIVTKAARGYMPSGGTPDRIVRAPFQEMDTKTGGGSLVSTVEDLIKWMRAIGKSEVLTKAMWAELFPSKDSVFGFQGRSPGFNAYVEHDRRKDRTTVVLANNYSAAIVSEVATAADRILGGATPVPLPVTEAVQVSTQQLRALAGFYKLPDGVFPVEWGTSVELRMVGNHIVAYLGTAAVDVLIPQGKRTFLARGLWSMIEAPADGAVDSIKVRALYADRSFTATRAR